MHAVTLFYVYVGMRARACHKSTPQYHAPGLREPDSIIGQSLLQSKTSYSISSKFNSSKPSNVSDDPDLYN